MESELAFKTWTELLKVCFKRLGWKPAEVETIKGGSQLGFRVVFPFRIKKDTFLNKIPPHIVDEIENIRFLIPIELKENNLTKKEKELWNMFLPETKNQQQQQKQEVDEDSYYSSSGESSPHESKKHYKNREKKKKFIHNIKDASKTTSFH